jgi:hypothetical protein
MTHGRPWEKIFYCGNRVLFVGSSPQKISKKFFWRQIFSHAGCGEVVSGTVCSLLVKSPVFVADGFISAYHAKSRILEARCVLLCRKVIKRDKVLCNSEKGWDKEDQDDDWMKTVGKTELKS